jgi:hypothetical protein
MDTPIAVLIVAFKVAHNSLVTGFWETKASASAPMFTVTGLPLTVILGSCWRYSFEPQKLDF